MTPTDPRSTHPMREGPATAPATTATDRQAELAGALEGLPLRPSRAEYDAWCRAHQLPAVPDDVLADSYALRYQEPPGLADPAAPIDQVLEFAGAQRRCWAIRDARIAAAADAPPVPASRVDTYLTRRAQQRWPHAVVYCDSDAPVPPAGTKDDARRFRLIRSGQPDIVLGQGGFREARSALDLLKRADAPA